MPVPYLWIIFLQKSSKKIQKSETKIEKLPDRIKARGKWR